MKKQPIQRSQQPPRQRVSRKITPVSATTPAHFPFTAWSRMTMPAWVVLPLRLFLGITFAYAGIQKLTDPQYFRPSAPGYIGKQIIGFASGSPLHNLLLQVAVPHATFFGGLIAWGELAIGLGVLIGLLVRPAAFCGAFLSLIFFLSASWRVHPYFYGADIVFLFSWTSIILAGPVAGGWPVLDARLVSWLLARLPEEQKKVTGQILWMALGVPETLAAPENEEIPTALSTRGQRMGQTVGRSTQLRGRGTIYARAQTRRDFFRGVASGVAGALGLVLLISLLRGGDSSSNNASGTGLLQNSAPSGTMGTTSGLAGPTSIAEVSQVPTNNSTSFSVPSNGDPGVLVHLSNGTFVAFDATCTHAGCTVQYDPSSQLLLCPCHGAAFDPAHGASVVQGPAPTPLTSVPVQVNQTTGAITVSS